MMRVFFLERQRILILIFLIICMAVAFWIRVIPAEHFSYPDYIGSVEPDVWYNLRQIEVMVNNFPQYNWFDPMTAFPHGKSVDWGPFFPFITAGLAILLGASSRPDIMVAASYIGPVIAVVLIPVVFILGKFFWDTLAGLIAALFITVGSFALYYRTTFGYIDHHAMETLLSTLFILTYTAALIYTKDHPLSRSNLHTCIRPIILSVLAGMIFVLGLMNTPTAILFALIVSIFTLAAFILHSYTGTSSDYMMIVNCAVFLIVLCALPFIRMDLGSIAVFQYSMGQFLFYLLLIVETTILWVMGRFLNNISFYVLAILIISLTGAVLLVISGSDVLTRFLSLFISQPSDIATIQEMQRYEIRFALLSYNYGIVLAAGGIIVLLWKTWISKNLRLVFLIIWTLIMGIISFQHRRFEYYFAINFVLLSGIAASWAFSTYGKVAISFFAKIGGNRFLLRNNSGDDRKESVRSTKKAQQRSRIQKEKSSPKADKTLILPLLFNILVCFLTVVLISLFVIYSVNNDLTYARDPTPYMTDPAWVETLQFLGENTPSPGIDYFGEYEKDTFVYPETAYGVMAWWDYGHYITFIARRIPNTNPFQDNIGPVGAAAFFIAQDEPAAEDILSHTQSHFIITDSMMAFGKFHAIAEWHNTTAGIDPYRKWLSFPSGDNQYILKTTAFNTPEYYRTLIARLHFYDGSEMVPITAHYMEYRNDGSYTYPLVISHEELPVAIAMERASTVNAHILPGSGATVLSSRVMNPLEELPALKHFRLVYESTADSSNIYGANADPKLRDTSQIKVFEYVRGAHIPGEGTIEAEIITNTGREFTYRQKSVNGEFIVPYSTSGNIWPVHTKGDYRVVETGVVHAVNEEDIHTN